jgi:3-isopropylmalate/(R)-2-methylmalate dehydratase small subunit
MEPFTSHTGRMVPLRRSNVDTDQIIPAVYLKRITRHGFADGLFAAWRSDPEFVLNAPERAGATVLVAGAEFGTGSSREHAVWALQDHGFRVVISSRFADIFRGNSLKGGLLAVELPQDVVEVLWDRSEADPAVEVSVDLAQRQVRCGDLIQPFDIDDYSRWRLLEGLDDIALTLRHTCRRRCRPVRPADHSTALRVGFSLQVRENCRLAGHRTARDGWPRMVDHRRAGSGRVGNFLATQRIFVPLVIVLGTVVGLTSVPSRAFDVPVVGVGGTR